MKFQKKLCILLSGALISCMAGFKTMPVHASSQFMKTDTASQLFAVPEGGYSSIRVDALYIEEYTSDNGYNILNNRSKSATYQAAYASSAPYVILDNVSHSNGKIFSNWTREQSWISGGKLSAGYYRNTDSVRYSSRSRITGTMRYRVLCDGAIPPQAAKGITMSFQ